MNIINKQRGASAWIVLAIVAVVGLAIVGSLIGTYNNAVRFENQIDTRYKDNQNVLGQYGTRVKEAVDVAGIYSDDLARITREAMEGRYGDQGSRAVFNWIQEQNQQVDASVYTNVQQLIEAGRNKFENNQTQLLDICQNYDNFRQTFPGNIVVGILGFPRDAGALAKKCTPIISSHARESFETGTDDGLGLRRNRD